MIESRVWYHSYNPEGTVCQKIIRVNMFYLLVETDYGCEEFNDDGDYIINSECKLIDRETLTIYPFKVTAECEGSLMLRIFHCISSLLLTVHDGEEGYEEMLIKDMAEVVSARSKSAKEDIVEFRCVEKLFEGPEVVVGKDIYFTVEDKKMTVWKDDEGELVVDVKGYAKPPKEAIRRMGEICYNATYAPPDIKPLTPSSDEV